MKMWEEKGEWNSMLLSFSFSNYRSFAEETVLDMTATSIKDHSYSLINRNGVNVLPLAAIYGPNASGKSNIFRAFSAMRNDILGRVYNEDKKHYHIMPYVFCKENVLIKPSKFEVSICIDDKEYRYGFLRNQTKVFNEWLYVKKFSKNVNIKEKMVFLKSDKSLYIGNIQEKEKKEIEYLESLMAEDELLLTAIGARKKIKYKNIYEWFANRNFIRDFSDDNTNKSFQGILLEFLFSHKDMFEEVKNLIKEFDPAIVDLEIIDEMDENLNKKYTVRSYHIADTGEKIYIPFDTESSGTKKIFMLSADFLATLELGKVLWIDELDAKLHPLMLRYIIKKFSNHETNNGGQLIFSSHNIVCMDSSDMRRDEIWFVEKNNQKSILYSLYDFKEDSTAIRSDVNFGKNYLAGRFGAVPFQNEEG